MDTIKYDGNWTERGREHAAGYFRVRGLVVEYVYFNGQVEVMSHKLPMIRSYIEMGYLVPSKWKSPLDIVVAKEIPK